MESDTLERLIQKKKEIIRDLDLLREGKLTGVTEKDLNDKWNEIERQMQELR